MVKGHCSSSKPINSCVPQGFVLSPTLFQLFINVLLSLSQCPIHSNAAEDSILHFSTFFSRRLNLRQVNDSGEDVTERLTSENLVLFNASKTQFLHLSTRQNLPDNYPLYFDDTTLSSSSTPNILGQYFTKTLNWKCLFSC